MNSALRERAQKLTQRRYAVELEIDHLSGGERVYVLSHPELPGCIAQGASIADAGENLADARFEYILSLLEDGQPVPEPMSVAATATITTGADIATKGETTVLRGLEAPEEQLVSA